MNRKNRITPARSVAAILVIILSAGIAILFRTAKQQFLSSAEIMASQITDLIRRNENEKTELQESQKEEYISRARTLVNILEHAPGLEENYDELCRAAELMSIDEIRIFGQDGLIAYSTVPDYAGFSIYSGGQIAFFERMMADHSLALCQDLTPNTRDAKLTLYAAVWRADDEGLVQVGITPERLLAA